MADQLAPKAAGNNPTRMAIYSRKQYDQIPRQKGGKKQLYKPDINMQSIIVIRRATKPVTQSGRTTQKLHKCSKRKTGQSLLIAVKDRFKSRAKPDHIHRNKYILQETTSSLH